MLCSNTIFHFFKNNNMNSKKVLCFLLPVLTLIVSELFGHNLAEHAQYYTKSAYWQNEHENMASPACPLVFDIVFFDGGERPSDTIQTITPECPLRSTIPGGQSVGVPIPLGEGGMPVPVWLEVFDPATGVMLLIKVFVTPEGCIGTIHIDQLYSTHPWDYSLVSENVSFTPLVGDNPSTALTLGFDSYINTGHLIANITAGYILKVYYCMPGRVFPGDGPKVPTNSSVSQSLRQLPANASTTTAFSESMIAKADQLSNSPSITHREAINFGSVTNNPVGDILHLRLHQADRSHIIEATLWSVHGQPISDRYIVAPGDTQVDIPTSSLSPGLYVLRLKSEGNIHSHIFIKM